MSDLNSISTQPQTATPKTSRPNLWLFQNGLFMIMAGLVFLVSGVFIRSPNWWAIFIFVPAVGLLWGAWVANHFSKGAFNLGVRLTLSSGLFMLVLALILVSGMNWRIAWPLMVILPGAIMFMNGITHPRLPLGSELASAANMQLWLGGSVMLLGLTFLLNQTGIIDLQATYGTFRWWWVFIFIPGLGALGNAIILLANRRASHEAGNLLAWAVLLFIEAGAEFIGLSWQLHFPLALMLCGGILFITSLRRN
jgi:hypothetical protein